LGVKNKKKKKKKKKTGALKKKKKKKNARGARRRAPLAKKNFLDFFYNASRRFCTVIFFCPLGARTSIRK